MYFGLACCLFQGFNAFLGLVGWSVLGLLKGCLESMQVFLNPSKFSFRFGCNLGLVTLDLAEGSFFSVLYAGLVRDVYCLFGVGSGFIEGCLVVC